MCKTTHAAVFLVAFSCLCGSHAVAESPDYAFPGSGGFAATLGSVPFLTAGEIAYGFGKGFALGAVA